MGWGLSADCQGIDTFDCVHRPASGRHGGALGRPTSGKKRSGPTLLRAAHMQALGRLKMKKKNEEGEDTGCLARRTMPLLLLRPSSRSKKKWRWQRQMRPLVEKKLQRMSRKVREHVDVNKGAFGNDPRPIGDL